MRVQHSKGLRNKEKKSEEDKENVSYAGSKGAEKKTGQRIYSWACLRKLLKDDSWAVGSC